MKVQCGNAMEDEAMAAMLHKATIVFLGLNERGCSLVYTQLLRNLPQPVKVVTYLYRIKVLEHDEVVRLTDANNAGSVYLYR